MALSDAELDAYIQQQTDAESAQKQADVQSMDMSKSVLSPEYRPRSAFGAQEIGGLAGSITGAALGTPFGPPGIAVGSTVGAGLGGALGETAAQLTGNEQISPQRIVGAGAEEAAWDAAGNLVMNIAGKAIKVGAQALGFGSKDIPDANQAADMFLKQYGSALPEAARTGSALDTMLEGITYTPATADIFIRKQNEIKQALTEGSQDILKSFSKSPEFDQALKSATSAQRASGDVLKSFINGGQEALSKEVKPIYQRIFKDVDSKVTTFPIKSWATQELSNPQGLTAGQRSILNEVKDLPPSLSMENMHDIRSRWLAENRDKYLSESNKDSRASKTISDLVGKIDNSMDVSAGRILDKDTYKEYQRVTKTYRDGIQGLQSDAINEAMKKDPEQVGAFLFKSGNETPIQDLFKSVSAASNLSNKPSKEIIDSLRYGYLQAMVNTPENMLKFAKNLEQDVKFKNTFNMLFNGTEQKAAIEAMAGAAEKGLVGAAHLPGLNMRTTGAAVGIGGLPAAVATGYYFTLSPDQQESLKDNWGNAAITGGSLIISQRQLAKLMLNPSGAKAVTRLSTARDKLTSTSAFTKLVVEPLVNVLGPSGERQTMFNPASSTQPLSESDLDAYIRNAK